jgi:DNA-directed RNA polymerase specialized sigma24 family protein
LRLLDPDPQRAEEKLLRLRLKIVAYLERRKVPWAVAEELAQEAILAVVQRLEAAGDGPEGIQSVEKYIWGISKNFLMQHWKTPDEKGMSFDPDAHGRLATGGADDGMAEKEFEQRREVCVERCLAQVPPVDRVAFLEYVQLEKHDRERREALAARLGVSRDTLYVKMHRLRATLETCCLKCMREYGYELR